MTNIGKIIRITTVPETFRDILKGQLKYLSENDLSVIAISSPGETMEAIQKQENVPAYGIYMSQKISPLFDLIALIRLILLFRKEKPDIIHSINLKAGLLSMLAGKLTRVPVRMHTFTGLAFLVRKGILQKISYWANRWVGRLATQVYADGEGVKKDLISHKITTKPINILANGNLNGIDMDYFNRENIVEQDIDLAKQKLDFKEGDFVFAYVGRLVKDKGISELIKAFDKLKNHHPKLLLIGDLDREVNALSLAEIHDIDVHRDVYSVGYQTDIRPYLAISDIFVFPSYREGISTALLEAGAMNLPAIVSDISGNDEVIKDGFNGVFVPVKNAKKLAEAMEKVMLDKELRQKLAENARSLVKEKFEQSLVREGLLNEYKSLMDTIPTK